MAIVQKQIEVEGMHCAGCERIIEQRLGKLAGIRQARASFARNLLDITYDDSRTGLMAIGAALTEEGYRLVSEDRPVKAAKATPVAKTGTTAVAGPVAAAATADAPAKKLSINQFIGLAIILVALVLIGTKTGLFNLFPQVTQSMGYGLLFLVGVLTSLHCVAMCGGINMSQCIPAAQATPGVKGKLLPSFLYNSGRVISYTVIGGIAGLIGSAVSFSGWARGIVAVVAGIFMVLMGVSMLGIFPAINRILPRMPRFLRSKAGKSGHGSFVVGLLNGFMPCGPLQAMQLYAVGTGSFLAGASSMLFFSLGTVPLMFGLGAVSTLLSRKFTTRMLQVSAVLVIVLGVLMTGRGLALSGVNVPNPVAKAQTSTQTDLPQANADGVQEITSQLTSGGYPEITVRAGVPVRWTIQADASAINGCNRTIIIPSYGIQKDLQPGDNVIEFTPKETGTIPYSCWMGMITSRIDVVDSSAQGATGQGGTGITLAADPAPTAPAAASGSSLLGSSCCASSAQAAARFGDGRVPTDQVQVAKVENGVQVATVTVDETGYSPALIVVQRGAAFRLQFTAKNLNSCNSLVVFPEYNGQLDLSSGELATPELTPEEDFTFQCGMGMLHGYVKVVDDINAINIEQIKQEVAAYEPPAGGASCCG